MDVDTGCQAATIHSCAIRLHEQQFGDAMMKYGGVINRSTEILKTNGIAALAKAVVQKAAGIVYMKVDLVCLEFNLTELVPRLAQLDTDIEVEQITENAIAKFYGRLPGDDSGLAPRLRSHNLFFAAYLDGTVVGVQRVRIGGPFKSKRFRKTIELGETEAVLTWTYIVPAHRGKGFSKPLQEAVLMHLSQRGYQRVIVWIESDNIPNLRLKRGRGFRDVERITRERILLFYQRNSRRPLRSSMDLRPMP